MKELEIILKVYNADEIKPTTGRMVLVEGGCAYWDGENWRTLMGQDALSKFPIITWPVKWWADLPKLQNF